MSRTKDSGVDQPDSRWVGRRDAETVPQALERAVREIATCTDTEAAEWAYIRCIGTFDCGLVFLVGNMTDPEWGGSAFQVTIACNESEGGWSYYSGLTMFLRRSST